MSADLYAFHEVGTILVFLHSRSHDLLVDLVLGRQSIGHGVKLRVEFGYLYANKR